MQPFIGKLINGPESFNWLTSSLSHSDARASLCSAFLKIDALHRIADFVPNSAKIRVLVRWKAGDLLMGASDPECYEFAKSKGWDFYLKQDFHGKLYSVDNYGILVGSWNATSSGFGLKSSPNDEIGTLVNQDPYNKSIVDAYYKSAVLVDDLIYSRILDFLQSSPDPGLTNDFPEELRNQLAKPVDDAGFLLSECFHSAPSNFLGNQNQEDESIRNDKELLGLTNTDFNNDMLARAFMASKIYRWTIKTASAHDGSISFGGLSAALHDALLENPKPYRSDVKTLVKNLFLWITFLGPYLLDIEITKPRHSEVIRLK